MDRALVEALVARGVDVVTALGADMIERANEEHLEWATAQGRVLYSFNVADFYQLHTDFLVQEKSHAAIVLAQQQRYSVGEQMRRLLRLIATLTAENMMNRVEFLSVWN